LLLEARGLSKSYEGIRAVSDVDLEIRTGEVHALVGENGAGKSTLVKMLGGLVRPDSGEIRIDGRVVHLRGPDQALRNGIAVIHQELLPFPDLTVAENICMGREPANRFGWIDRRAMNKEARALLGRIGMSIDPRRVMRRLSIAEMQTVEIAKALGYESRLIIMDEPTSALSGKEVEALLSLIGDLKHGGVSVIYISHRMEEIFRVPDRITVMRDGRVVATHVSGEVTEAALVSEMVGRELATVFPKMSEPGTEVVLSIRDIAGGNVEVHRGEILGIAGLMGAGRTELVSAIAGLDVGGVQPRRTAHPCPTGVRISMVTEDRKDSGIIPEMSVAQNITLSALKDMCKGPFLNRDAEAKAVNEQTQRLAIKCSSPAQKIARLSGGNQQKALLARALLTNPDVLILDEPTRGIDVGAKSEVYAIIAELARSGKAIIMVSSELPEVLALSHRILVMREGKIRAELNAKGTTAEEVLACAMPQ
jgi:ABC-type sugar transport system ATPase subunit